MSGRVNFQKGKKIWTLRTKEGKFVENFWNKSIAKKTKKYYKEKYFMELDLIKEEKWD